MELQLQIIDNAVTLVTDENKTIPTVTAYCEHYDEIEYLPADHGIELGEPIFNDIPTIHSEDFGTFEFSDMEYIDDNDYRIELDIEYHAQDYFARWARSRNTYGAFTLCYKGYAHLYLILRDAGYTLPKMIEEFSGIANTWQEGTATDVLDYFDYDDSLDTAYDDNTSREILDEKATNIFFTCDNASLEWDAIYHDDDGHRIYLFSAS